MTRTYTVTGMSCGGCEETVEDAVGALEGVDSVSADNETDSVSVEGSVDDAAVRQAIEDAGYTVDA